MGFVGGWSVGVASKSLACDWLQRRWAVLDCCSQVVLKGMREIRCAQKVNKKQPPLKDGCFE